MTKKKITNQKGDPVEIADHDEPYRPMAAPEPSPLERLEALELRVKVLEGNCRASHGMR